MGFGGSFVEHDLGSLSLRQHRLEVALDDCDDRLEGVKLSSLFGDVPMPLSPVVVFTLFSHPYERASSVNTPHFLLLPLPIPPTSHVVEFHRENHCHNNLVLTA